jgi:predicted RNase H-like HicB family nuclease
MTVQVLYRQRAGGAWVATTPEIPKLRVVASSYDEAHERVEEVIRFALDTADVAIEHAARP